MEGGRGCRLAFKGGENRAKMLIYEGSLQEIACRRRHFQETQIKESSIGS